MAEVSMCNSNGAAELSPEEERVLIRDIALAAGANSKEGDEFFLITQRWWQHWIEYVNLDQQNSTNEGSSVLNNHSDSVSSSKRPAGIDNSDLIYDSASHDDNISVEIHDSLLEGRDYVLLPQDVWNQLHSWYGGGPPLARKVISSGLSQTELAVEETIGELHRRSFEIFNLNAEQVCIWDYYGHQKHALMNDMDKTLDDANIQMDQDILVEVLSNVNGTALSGHMCSVNNNGSAKKEATSILLEPSKSTLSIAGGFPASKGASRSCSSEISQARNMTLTYRELDNAYGISCVSTRGSYGGLTGLQNLGNTCFMNSAIQCLVHTPEFAKYFREDYHREINWQNPFGMVGELALAFGDLLRKLWAPGRAPIAPRPFKAKLARFAPQFSGYSQHDSQELLAFLLDGLHEDLNRVKQKPYIKSRDADGRPDEEVADEYWANHIARNNSIIVDVCQGQYKSTLVCPICNKVSVTFDPFMYLSLPLQSATTRSMTLTILTSDSTTSPFPCTVSVPKHGWCRDLIQAVSIACSLKTHEELKLAEVRNHQFHRFLDDPCLPLSSIKDDDRIAAYKISKSSKNSLLLRLIHRCRPQETGSNGLSSQWNAFGVPLIASIPYEDSITRGDIQREVQKILLPWFGGDNLIQDTDGDICADYVTDSPKTNGCPSKTLSLKFSLQMADKSNELIDLSAKEGKSIRVATSSAPAVVYVDWSRDLIEKCSAKYFENLPEVFRYGPVSKKARTEPLSLYTCLEAFLREEPLVPEDMWYCPQCKERRQASKKLDLWRLPEVLVIHLKRFSYSRSMKHKLETFVNFPIRDFDLTNYVGNKNSTQRQLYELYALTNHYGGMGSGHYTAHIKLLEENKWYNFDDSHISLINEDDVKSAAAYVLFYRRARSNDNVLTSNGALPIPIEPKSEPFQT
ncbi:unnamed protein product [Linum tenue]|uniref:Ubiquitin carboxyl-terminal hydrolase n=1 Tax=Linum tenue TaxID=586396 RepID=A0AAV0M1I2_9ROSI|nr:unnamed protein product [Linum tenue]